MVPSPMNPSVGRASRLPRRRNRRRIYFFARAGAFEGQARRLPYFMSAVVQGRQARKRLGNSLLGPLRSCLMRRRRECAPQKLRGLRRR